jgi:nucleoside-diphosphate-sugar epimerase
VFNVATGRRISLNELYRRLSAMTGSTLAPTYAPPRAGDVRDSLADVTRAREVLGYAPTVDLDEGLRRTLDWCRSSRASAPRS